MQEYYQKLLVLLDKLKNPYLPELPKIYSDYTSILDYINGYSADYKRRTNSFYEEADKISDRIHKAKYGGTKKEKDESFADACRWLRSDIKDLAGIIKDHD